MAVEAVPLTSAAPQHTTTQRQVKAQMFFFSNRLGCGKSLFISAVATIILLLVLGVIPFPGR